MRQEKSTENKSMVSVKKNYMMEIFNLVYILNSLRRASLKMIVIDDY